MCSHGASRFLRLDITGFCGRPFLPRPSGRCRPLLTFISTSSKYFDVALREQLGPSDCLIDWFPPPCSVRFSLFLLSVRFSPFYTVHLSVCYSLFQSVVRHAYLINTFSTGILYMVSAGHHLIIARDYDVPEIDLTRGERTALWCSKRHPE